MTTFDRVPSKMECVPRIDNNRLNTKLVVQPTQQVCNVQSSKSMAASYSCMKWKPKEGHQKVCEQCGKTFTTVYSLKRHQSSYCQTERAQHERKVKCSLCDFLGSGRRSVFSHYVNCHKIKMEKTTEYFQSFEEFLSWKSEFESQTLSCYVKTRSSRLRRTDLVEIAQYVCHRDGKYVPSGRAERQCKSQGSNKINAHCPARMDVYKAGDIVKVSCVLTHVGHELEICRMYLTKEEKAFIAERLTSGIPFDTILEEIRSLDTVGDTPRRIQLLKRKDLWNIVQSLNLSSDFIKAEHDYAVFEEKKLKEIGNCHKKSLQLSQLTVTRTDASWLLESAAESHTVQEKNLVCSCELRCQDCEVCLHSYTCSCKAYSDKWLMCEHIHFVCQLLKTQSFQIMQTLDGFGQFEPVIVPIMDVVDGSMPVNDMAAQEVYDGHFMTVEEQNSVVVECDDYANFAVAYETVCENDENEIGENDENEIEENDENEIEENDKSELVISDRIENPDEGEVFCQVSDCHRIQEEGTSEENTALMCETNSKTKMEVALPIRPIDSSFDRGECGKEKLAIDQVSNYGIQERESVITDTDVVHNISKRYMGTTTASSGSFDKEQCNKEQREIGKLSCVKEKDSTIEEDSNVCQNICKKENLKVKVIAESQIIDCGLVKRGCKSGEPMISQISDCLTDEKVCTKMQDVNVKQTSIKAEKRKTDVIIANCVSGTLDKVNSGRKELAESGETTNSDFEKRKHEALDKVLSIHNLIENEEQLEIFERQIVPLEHIVKALAKAEIVLSLPREMVVSEPPRKRILVQRVYNI